ncbi:hypothetical protein GCM10007103_26760 [Salinimicrobium marinum]|uniref:Riboflavin synthase subunit beta n=1 Tax=Salinimicrobium marinum TaxID=680283 RepID=A0A918VYZ5_9FLAO|nr:hypothetical protein [Salinimicrobium marinum]GHA44187.1 hypothetical protein GCM10007103_26760 [Salinimicrobium marinum]
MKINIYKTRKNARYNYTPRYYKGKDTGNIYDFNSRFHKYKETTNAIDFGSQWAEARESSRNRGNREVNTRVLVIIAILVLIFLWIIDFDLSIFSTPQ